ncbi:ParB/RepB/Spo0J family partition protein [Photorhabdus luminescens]|uniref:ParB/RepB/Spo0J family partition protein n=1 Tax=Photorhabdus luminescens TaxID=29488 RepID=UPI00223EC420|nr:ParB/RepB/Spo0J family partition protein [Photorhabdus luminescens]MCW7764554.1 ParB/RepB/Spo0J family partition protein [Photorhabdus luminescens subsp. venezuelensis]
MSETNVKASTKASKAAKKSSRKSPDVAQSLVMVLEQAIVELVPYSHLSDTDQNVRFIPYSQESVEELATSIAAVGILQNLVVVEMPDGSLGVAAGGRRKAALALLIERGVIQPDQLIVPVKKIPADLAVAASMTENGQRKDMHPAEQIVGFHSMASEGKIPAQIGDLLGYSPRHVQRMLKLASLAPAILDMLAKDEITTEHCHVLALENNQERQLQVLEAARQQSYNGRISVYDIRRIITASEVLISNNSKFKFVGAGAFTDGEIRRDLFSENEDGYVDTVLLDSRVMSKLEQSAIEIEEAEGWSWSLARMERVKNWGEDGLKYVLLPEPAPEYTPDEQTRRDKLMASLDALDSFCDEAEVLEAQINDIEQAVINRAWTDEQKNHAGIVVSYHNGCLCVQRGVLLKEDEVQDKDNSNGQSNIPTNVITPPKNAVDNINLPLLKAMSSERTLAVQAALAQQTQTAVALLAWTLCMAVFGGHSMFKNPLQVRLNTSHRGLCESAPTGENGQAYTALMEQKEHIKALLPEGWKKDFTWLLAWPVERVHSLMGFCVACGIDGVQNRECGRTQLSPLDELETIMGFHLRDWWQPTKDDFFGRLSKAQICEALTEAGLTGAASDVEKMKKGDVAEFAEKYMANNRWVPEWMKTETTETHLVSNDIAA